MEYSIPITIVSAIVGLLVTYLIVQMAVSSAIKHTSQKDSYLLEEQRRLLMILAVKNGVKVEDLDSVIPIENEEFKSFLRNLEPKPMNRQM